MIGLIIDSLTSVGNVKKQLCRIQRPKLKDICFIGVNSKREQEIQTFLLCISLRSFKIILVLWLKHNNNC